MEEILRKLWNHEISVDEALKELKYYPFKDIGNAKIDFYRYIHKKVPEVIYGNGKSAEEIRRIAKEMMSHHKVFITKVEKDIYEKIGINEARYYEDAKMVVIGERKRINEGYIAIVTAGSSDKHVAEEAAVTAYELGNDVKRIYDVGAAGLHRLLANIDEIEGASVVIVVAGMDGILPTIVANFVSSPVIAVPTSIGYGTGINGLVAMATMLNSCSPGIVVVNIDNGFGAGVAAHLINTRK